MTDPRVVRVVGGVDPSSPGSLSDFPPEAGLPLA